MFSHFNHRLTPQIQLNPLSPSSFFRNFSIYLRKIKNKKKTYEQEIAKNLYKRLLQIIITIVIINKRK